MDSQSALDEATDATGPRWAPSAAVASGAGPTGAALFETAAHLSQALGAPSPLGTVLFSAFVTSMEIDAGEHFWGVSAGAALMGYASRMGQRAGPVPDAITADIGSQLVLNADGQIDYDELAAHPERIGCLLDSMAALVEHPADVASLAGCSTSAWLAFSDIAVARLTDDLVCRGVPRPRLPGGEASAKVVRLGYVVRLIDEMAGEQPATRNPRSLRTATVDALDHSHQGSPIGTELETDSWLRDAQALCARDYEPSAERLLRLGALEAIGRAGSMTTRGSLADLLGSARFGFSLRARECQLIAGSRLTTAPDALRTALAGRDDAGTADLLCDVIRYGYCGGAVALLDVIPGTSQRARAEALDARVDRIRPDEDDEDPLFALGMVQYGYLLHRTFEIRAHRAGVALSPSLLSRRADEGD